MPKSCFSFCEALKCASDSRRGVLATTGVSLVWGCSWGGIPQQLFWRGIGLSVFPNQSPPWLLNNRAATGDYVLSPHLKT